MKIVRAQHLGMRFGVREAIALAFEHGAAKPLTILGDLVHNATVSAALQRARIAIAHDVADVKTHTVMVTAHGASLRRIAATPSQGLEVLEATCPLVHVAHRAVACGRYCPHVHHVQTDADLQAGWFCEAESVGITAGTSTPDQVVDRVEQRIRELAAARTDGTSHGEQRES